MVYDPFPSLNIVYECVKNKAMIKESVPSGLVGKFHRMFSMYEAGISQTQRLANNIVFPNLPINY